MASLIKCELVGTLGHEELFEQGLDHLPDGVGTADMKRVHAAVATRRQFSRAWRGLRRFAEFHLDFDEASVNPI